MDPYTFLEKVLPDSGTWYRGGTNIPNSPQDVPPPGSDFETIKQYRKRWIFSRNMYGATLHEVAATILSKHEAAATKGWPSDAYFCISTASSTDSKGDASEWFRSVYIDLDVRENGDGQGTYRSAEEALKGMFAFLKTTKLPEPSLVYSGHGIHAYWVFDRNLSVAEWKPMALALKGLAYDSGLKLDLGVTGDTSRLARLPGTVNPMTGRRAKVIRGDFTQISFSDFTALLPNDPLTTYSTANRSKPKAGSIAADILAGLNDLPPAQAGLIYNGCAQVRHCVDNQEGLPEPLWHALLGVAAYCESPEEVAHAWSHKDSRYDADETRGRIDRLKGATTGATLCQNFQEQRPEGCAQCPHATNDKVRSPIILGVRTPEVAAPGNRPTDIASVAVPDLPYPYKRTVDGIKILVDGIEVTVCPFDIYPVSYGYDEAAGWEIYRFHWNRPHVGWRELSFRTALINSAKLTDFTTEISDQGIVLESKEGISQFQTMLRRYMDQLRETRTVTNLYSTMGWKDGHDEFVLGDQIFRRRNGGVEVEEISHIGASAQREAANWNQMGSLQEWCDFTRVLDSTNMLGHMFAVAVAMSAPLYKFTGLNGLVVSLAGDTGGGKSIAQLWGQSVWGEPQSLLMTSQFTDPSLFARMGHSAHLPIAIDEVTTLPPHKINEIIYNVSQGKEKHRLNRNAEARKQKTWAAPCIMSTNIPLTDKLLSLGVNITAQQARLFEVTMPVLPMFKHDTSAGRTIAKFLKRNHGTMGREIVAMLLAMPTGQLESEIESHPERFMQKYNAKFSGQERFWEAAVLLADYMSSKIYERGLLPFNPERCIRWAVEQAQGMRETATENQEDSFSIMASYLNEMASMSLVAMYNSPGAKPLIDPTRVPRGEIHVRFNLMRQQAANNPSFSHGYMLIDRVHLRRWLLDRHCDWSGFLEGLGVALLKNKERKAYLAKDSGVRLGQSNVIAVDLAHPEMQGILTDADNNTAAPKLATVTNLQR
jgi:hypothetical protein